MSRIDSQNFGENMTNLNRRKVIVGAIGATCLNTVKAVDNKVENTFYESDLNQSFTIGFTFKESFALNSENKAISIKASKGQGGLVIQVEFDTYLKKYKSKPVVAKIAPGSPNQFISTWDGNSLIVYVNKRLALELKTSRRSSRHAKPLMKEFKSLNYSGLLSGFRSCNHKISTDEFDNFLEGNVKNQDSQIIGPCIGQVSEKEVCLWIRGTAESIYTLEVLHNKKSIWKETKQASLKNDLTVNWIVKGLQENTEYEYKLAGPSTPKTVFSFKTASLNPKESSKILFGSCAAMSDIKLYQQFSKINPDSICFMGDTPYIDTGSLDVHRHSHREFLKIDSLSKILSKTPYVSTWDDHDFGVNNCDGKFSYKNNSLKAFKEYRPQLKHGDGKEGIYTSFRRGPVEVFMLDCRWFSYLKKSIVKGSQQKTLLGEEQWKWLFESLSNSKAIFKILACGIIWDDKLNREKDDWETYSDERKKLFDFIKSEMIEGVVLLGGDIHVSRHLDYGKDKVGYPLHQFISSPMHDSVIKSLNTKHESLKWSALQKNTCLVIEAGEKTLVAKYLNDEGKVINQVNVHSDDLKFK